MTIVSSVADGAKVSTYMMLAQVSRPTPTRLLSSRVRARTRTLRFFQPSVILTSFFGAAAAAAAASGDCFGEPGTSVTNMTTQTAKRAARIQ